MLDNWWEDLPGTGNSSHVVVGGGGGGVILWTVHCAVFIQSTKIYFYIKRKTVLLLKKFIFILELFLLTLFIESFCIWNKLLCSCLYSKNMLNYSWEERRANNSFFTIISVYVGLNCPFLLLKQNTVR